MVSNSGYSENNQEPLGYKSDDQFFIVNSCGNDKFYNTSFWQRRFSGRKDYYLIYVKKGVLSCNINRTPYKINKGEVIIIDPDISHEIYYSDKVYHEVFWVNFTGYGVTDVLQQLNLICEKIYYVEDCPVIDNLFMKIIKELQIKSKSYIIICSGYLVELLTSISRCKKNCHGNTHASESELHKIMNYLNESYHHQHTIEELANKCNLSPYYFIRKFKKVSGYSPQKYLLRIRMENAKKMLVESNLNIGDIGTMVGFKNALYFSKAFKEFVGISPSQFRKILQDTED
ncbi:AraC family transcriptional regulator [Vallitalea guaymasensis]|uniref:AraC family transcriptional regulator n=1 Tax=Vallitalea guaymasensis TaxID=1185412 RepID=UPI000DE52C5E|nr:AraC family transcriptional regulator [Vallitalea guaymasensis]